MQLLLLPVMRCNKKSDFFLESQKDWTESKKDLLHAPKLAQLYPLLLFSKDKLQNSVSRFADFHLHKLVSLQIIKKLTDQLFKDIGLFGIPIWISNTKLESKL